MNREHVLTRWMNAAGPWSQFVKPALIAQLSESDVPWRPDDAQAGWAPTDGETMLVVDLPAPHSVALGVALADLGFCVVPMFNTTRGTSEVVPTPPIVAVLWGAAERLGRVGSSPVGPPVFLLDRNRQHIGIPLEDGDFDNRWYVFAADFPSPELLAERGIHRVTVVAREVPSDDLKDALAKYARLRPALIDPQTGAVTGFPAPRVGIARAIDGFGRALSQNPNGSFGHRHTVSQG